MIRCSPPRAFPAQRAVKTSTPPPAQPPGPPAEAVRILSRRIEKAERDERMSITMAMTPPKTHMGGFTRPQKIVPFNWLPGGHLSHNNKLYEPPPPQAYEPHTVFLLEGRYLSRQSLGRVDAVKYIVEVCQEGDLEAVLRRYNSHKAPAELIEAMDNARWPWVTKRGKLKEIKSKHITSEEEAAIFQEAAEDVEDIEHLQEEQGAELDIPPPVEHPTEHLPDPDTPPPSTSRATSKDEALRAATRAKYLPTLSTTPFFRPLLTITLPTRPLALSILRLSKSLINGLPFNSYVMSDLVSPMHFFIPSLRPKKGSKPPQTEFQHPSTYNARTRCLRLDRLLHLSSSLAELLIGARGGIAGLRFSPDTLGRGLNPHDLVHPLTPSQRTISIGVGAWYKREEELRRDYELTNRHILERYTDTYDSHTLRYSSSSPDPFAIYQLDEFGKRFIPGTSTQVPWAPVKQFLAPSSARELTQLRKKLPEYKYIEGPNAKQLSEERKELIARIDALNVQHIRELAAWKAARHARVTYAG
ncbi:hypothetical protein AMATHDRAFT_88557 [Amanita thiersii Skay4041]|uniref:Uncharacterized protein n=1 Tax=Amanita thiersii Skay4041 TaxID=703135 RepID=A0A2A9NE78_9AGAR|nr:hypothetical protein AMATHDRAFT_88557 [Amanita thiersii Skay4041]